MNPLSEEIVMLMNKKKTLQLEIEEAEGEKVKELEELLEEVEDQLEEKRQHFTSLWEFRRITDEYK